MWWCPYTRIGQDARSRGSRNSGGAARWSIGVNTQQAGTPRPRREARHEPHMQDAANKEYEGRHQLAYFFSTNVCLI